MFDSIARRYDFANRVLSFGMDLGWRRAAVRLGGIGAGLQVLDLCCGTGDFAFMSAEAGASSVTGVDFSDPMLAVANARLARLSAPEMAATAIRFLKADALQLPFPPASFDRVTVGWGLRNLEDLDRGLREILRVLKPGGELIALESTYPRNPLFRYSYSFYFISIVPALGWMITGNLAAYRYLPRTAASFPAREDLLSRLRAAGFASTEHRDLALGAVVLYLATK